MCESRRGRTVPALERDGAAPLPHRGRARGRDRFFRRGHLARDDELHRRAVGIGEPRPVLVRQGMRLGPFNAQRVDALHDPVIVVRIGAEAHVLKAFRPGRLVDRAPPMFVTESAKIEASALPAHIEAEIRIERGRDIEIGNREDEAMQRMHRHRAVAARRGPG